MLKKTLYLLLIPIFAFVISCDKNKKDKSKQYLTINIVSDPLSLNPMKIRDLNSVILSKLFFDGLMRVNEDKQIKEAIAESYKISDDNKIFTFQINKNAFWSNGDKVTAYDFEYSWKKKLSKAFLSSTASSLFVIKNAKEAKKGKVSIDEIGITAIDENTLVIELEKPCPYFLRMLTTPAFFAVNKKVDIENSNWAQDSKTFVSNGAFTLGEWKQHDFIVAKKNKFYWDAKRVKLEKISMLMLTIETEHNMFDLNQLDIAGSPFSTLIVESLKKLKNEKTYNVSPYFGTSFLRINTQKIDDVNFRKDLMYAFDREKITEHILQGGQIPTSKLVPIDKKIDTPIIKKDYAKRKIVLTYASSDRAHVIAQALQRDLSTNLNLDVELKALEKQSFYEKLGSLDYEIALSSWIADFEDKVDFLNVFKYKNSSTNNTGWENQKYINLLQESETILDQNKRDETLSKAEDILLDEAAIIPIYHLTQNFLKKENLKDVFIYPNGFIDFKYAYFE
ncbi:MAG: Oligopeptide-binding protein OppA [Candidatus Anoxychlamydiales bacterium]|nr:Oligopeptide-binding protein OppA [Candidatus Anoxychlamydiales bacterium]